MDLPGLARIRGEKLSNEQRIAIAYRAMFDREPDASGMATHKSMLDTGMSLRAVISGFSQSSEYKAMCARYGMVAGTIGVIENRDMNRNATEFVQRLYRNVLGRSADTGGLNSHTGSLLFGNNATSLSWAFFSSPEFTNRRLNNDALIETLYTAMLDRASDPSGKASWMANIDRGMSLFSLVTSFASSPEFRSLCIRYGIAPDRYWNMDSRVSGLSSRTQWLIAVDTTGCFVSVYNGRYGNWHAVNRFDCAPGKASTPSRLGIYTVGIKGYVFGHGYSCYYYTQYSGDYLFHSIKYNPGTFNVQDGTMGAPASEGCIRLWIENAKYIYDNVPYGSTVLLY